MRSIARASRIAALLATTLVGCKRGSSRGATSGQWPGQPPNTQVGWGAPGSPGLPGPPAGSPAPSGELQRMLDAHDNYDPAGNMEGGYAQNVGPATCRR